MSETPPEPKREQFSFTTRPTRARADSPPKTSAPKKTASASDDVASAVATMNAIYGAVGVALMLTQHPQTANKLALKKSDLENTNREAFEASPQLAKLIAGAAMPAALSTFFVAHVTVGFSIVQELRAERAAKSDEPGPSEERPDGTTAPYLG